LVVRSKLVVHALIKKRVNHQHEKRKNESTLRLETGAQLTAPQLSVIQSAISMRHAHALKFALHTPPAAQLSADSPQKAQIARNKILKL